MAAGADVEVPTGVPHSLQNLAAGGRGFPQVTQASANCEPHAVQNRPPALFSVLQVGQSIIVPVDPHHPTAALAAASTIVWATEGSKGTSPKLQ